ncbi:MAG: protein kinase [Phycisphaeraceae bacterium]|nr:protein kinase [Phycisphaeraceae bacterium]
MSDHPNQQTDAATGDDPTRTPRPSHPLPAEVASDAADLPVPQRIGKYTIRRLIASGGMGSVFEAVQEQPHRTVAVKVMKGGQGARSTRRFELESQLLARLHHPGIAQVYDAGVYPTRHGSAPYFVMEYVPSGLPITGYAEIHGLNLRERLALFVKVCEAVDHGHRQGVLHRDLKPGNIIVDDQGNAKIIDFGVALAIGADATAASIGTLDGQLVGTLQYMSPEQVGDSTVQDIDERSDVYSLGVVLYELVYGRIPYDVTEVSLPNAVRMIQQVPCRPPPESLREVPNEVARLIEAATEKDPALRIRSAADLARNTQRYLDGEPLDVLRASLAYLAAAKTRSYLHRHRAVPLAAITVASVVVAFLVGVPLVYRYTSLNSAYERSLAGLGGGFDRFESVRMIGIGVDEETVAAAAEAGITDFKGNAETTRRLNTALMERLLGSGARVVALDFHMPSRTPIDEGFASAARSLRQSGIDVVACSVSWAPVSQDDYAGMSPTIAREVQVGTASGQFSDHYLWKLDLFVQRGDEPPRESLALAAFGCWRHPGVERVVGFDRPNATVTVNYVAREAEARHIIRTIAPTDRVVLTAGHEPETQGDAGFGLRPGDTVGYFALPMPPIERFREAMYSAAQVLRASPGQLREWFEGKAVVVGRTDVEADTFPHSALGKAPGFWGHSSGLELLIRGAATWSPSANHGYAATLIGALLGILFAALWPQRALMRALAVAGAAVLAIAASLAWYRIDMTVYFNPMVPLVATLIAAEAGSLFLRRFHAPST